MDTSHSKARIRPNKEHSAFPLTGVPQAGLESAIPGICPNPFGTCCSGQPGGHLKGSLGNEIPQRHPNP